MSKNQSGRMFANNRKAIDHMVEVIDRRVKKAETNTTDRRVENACTFCADGSRVWSF